MKLIGYALAFLAVLGLASVAMAGDCYGVQQQVQFAPQYTTGGCGSCVQAQAQVYVPQQQVFRQEVQYAPVQQQVFVQRQVQYVPQVQQVVVQRQVYAPPVRQVVVQKQVFRQQAAYSYGGGFQSQAFVQQRSFGGGRQFVGGGFGGGGGPFRQGFAQGGIIGGLERFTGLGSGNGDFGRGAIIGVLGARSNLFGLGRR